MFLSRLRSDHEEIKMILLQRGIDVIKREYNPEGKMAEVISMLDWNVMVSKKKIKLWMQAFVDMNEQELYDKLHKEINQFNENPKEIILPKDAVAHDIKVNTRLFCLTFRT
jgi:hypothetical protein